MKFVFVMLAAFLVLEGSSLTIPDQQHNLEAQNTLQGLERVKRGCGKFKSLLFAFTQNVVIKHFAACGPNGCLCSLKDTDESFLKLYLADESSKEETDQEKTDRRGCCEY